MGFFSWLVNKIRFKRLAVTGSSRVLTYGGFYAGAYSNFKHDPNPLIFVMWSDDQYTHGINTHYMNRSDKAWFGRTLYLMKKGRQNVDPRTMYKLLKLKRMSIVRDCYRMYHTRLLNMKLVGAGLTNMDKMVYKKTQDPWLLALNEQLAPKSIDEFSYGISYNSDELRSRIIQAQNAQDITKNRTGSFGTSPYAGSAPWRRP